MRPDSCWSRSATVLHDRRQVLDDAADDGVLVGQRVGQRRDVLEQALHRAGLALEHLDDLVGDAVDVGRRQRLQQGLEAAEQRGQVQRRRGLRERDERVLRQRPAGGPVALGQGDVALPDEVAVADRGQDAGGQRHVGVHLEGDLGDRLLGGVGEPDAGHLTHADAGDAHLVALDQAGDVAELRPVGELLAVPGIE